MANNKGIEILDEQIGKAAGEYIVVGGFFGDDKAYDSKGNFLTSTYLGSEAKGYAKGKGESTMKITEDELEQLQKRGYFTRGNKKYHDNTVEYL